MFGVDPLDFVGCHVGSLLTIAPRASGAVPDAARVGEKEDACKEEYCDQHIASSSDSRRFGAVGIPSALAA